MAISPKKAKDNITDKEVKDMDLIEKHIDDYLMENYMGHTITVKLPANTELTQRMAVRLEKTYKAAGWAQCEFSVNNKTVNLSEYANNTCYGYDR